MPTYEYRCTDGHRFEVFQSMSKDPVTKCEVCGKPVERVFHAPAAHFKGSGFYTTDYARKGAKAESGSDSKDSGSKDSGSKDSGSKDSGSKNGDSGSSSSKDSKSETKSGSSSD